MSKFNEFFEELASNADLMNEYKHHPQDVMQRHGLSEEEIHAVMTADAQKIKALSGGGDFKMFIHIQNPSS